MGCFSGSSVQQRIAGVYSTIEYTQALCAIYIDDYETLFINKEPFDSYFNLCFADRDCLWDCNSIYFRYAESDHILDICNWISDSINCSVLYDAQFQS